MKSPVPHGDTARSTYWRSVSRSSRFIEMNSVQADPWRGHMNSLDWTVLIGYFGVMIAIGFWSHKRVDNVSDFFTAAWQNAVVAVGHLPPHVRLQRGDVHRVRRNLVPVRTHIHGHLVAPDRHRHRDRREALRAPAEPAALPAARGLTARIPQGPLQHPDPAGAGLVRAAAEDRGRRRQVGGHLHPALRLHRHHHHPGHLHHRRHHRHLLHGRRALGRRAHRAGAVHHPVDRRCRDAGRRHGQARWLQRPVDDLGQAPQRPLDPTAYRTR